MKNFTFSPSDLAYLRGMPALADAEDEFFVWLESLDTSEVKIFAVPEGSVVFPRIPLLRIEGPLGICQLLETTLLNLTNFASLITTNAARMRQAAGPDKTLLEFGLRRAQGSDGAMSASRYAVLGGFDGTSNVLSGKLFGLNVGGTHAHSFVCSLTSLDDITRRELDGIDFVARCLKIRDEEGYRATNEGELAAFITYALAFPKNFLALVDTYDTLGSGVPNFLVVAKALHGMGYAPKGIRLDSGDLAWLSREARRMFIEFSRKHKLPFERLNIVASNDINEAVLHALNEQEHSIDTFGIGTNLVTCQAQPALGMVFKLVEMEGKPRIKLSQEITKVTIPGAKEAYRLISAEGTPILDYMIRQGEAAPTPGRRLMCRHPFDEKKRAWVTPSQVMPLHVLVWDGKNRVPSPSLVERKQYVQNQLKMVRQDHLRGINPTPYKVSVSPDLYSFIHELWLSESPIAELS